MSVANRINCTTVSQYKPQDHGHRAGTSRGMPIYSKAFTDIYYPTQEG